MSLYLNGNRFWVRISLIQTVDISRSTIARYCIQHYNNTRRLLIRLCTKNRTPDYLARAGEPMRVFCEFFWGKALQWRYNDRDGVSNHRRLDCLLNGLFRYRSKKTSKLRVTGLYDGNSPVTGVFPAQSASNVSIWWRHHGTAVSGIHSINAISSDPYTELN